MSKYIVKNCPSYSNGYIGCTAYRVSSCFCESCTDCLIKQVIEKCKFLKSTFDYDKGSNYVTNEILQLFEIEECE